MISLGQSNTIVSCPALTTHSELDEQALLAAGLTKTTVRCAVGDEDPIDLIRHVVHTAKCTIDSKVAGFSSNFMSDSDIRALIRDEYVSAHSGHVERQLAECEIFNHN
jgi:hypothetical protein